MLLEGEILSEQLWYPQGFGEDSWKSKRKFKLLKSTFFGEFLGSPAALAHGVFRGIPSIQYFPYFRLPNPSFRHERRSPDRDASSLLGSDHA
jgi:hypothetical protein